MIEAVTSGLSTVLGWVGTVLDSLLTAEGELAALLPLLAISAAISGIFLGVKVIRGMIWGV